MTPPTSSPLDLTMGPFSSCLIFHPQRYAREAAH
jgi:hypothetical protein